MAGLSLHVRKTPGIKHAAAMLATCKPTTVATLTLTTSSMSQAMRAMYISRDDLRALFLQVIAVRGFI